MSRRGKQFSAAVVGTGFIGPVHVEGLRRAGVHVAGIVGSTPDKSQAAAEQLGVTRCGASRTKDMLDDCRRLNLPSINSPVATAAGY